MMLEAVKVHLDGAEAVLAAPEPWSSGRLSKDRTASGTPPWPRRLQCNGQLLVPILSRLGRGHIQGSGGHGMPYQHVDLESAKARELLTAFECRYQRDLPRPCKGVMCYDEVTDEGYESLDEVPLGLRREVVENWYGELY
jgi:hypothetical protein